MEFVRKSSESKLESLNILAIYDTFVNFEVLIDDR
jgi:hypothetical protein